MNITDSVDVHDPPAITLADLESQQRQRLAWLTELWTHGHSRVTRGRAKTYLSVDMVESILARVGGNKSEAVLILHVGLRTLDMFLEEHGIADKWRATRGTRVYTDRGESWPNSRIAANAIGCHENSVRNAVSGKWRCQGRRFSRQPFPHVEYQGVKRG